MTQDLQTLAEKAIEARQKKDGISFNYYAKEVAKLVGKWDEAGRYFILNDYKTSTSQQVRTPSRAWPKSEYNHVKTLKYIKSLLQTMPAYVALSQAAQLKNEFKTTPRKVVAL